METVLAQVTGGGGRRPGGAARAAFLVLLLLGVVGLLVLSAGAEATKGPLVTSRAGSIEDADLVDYWFARHREGWYQTLDELIDERIVQYEARRLGIEAPPEAVAKALADEVAAREAQLRETYGDEVLLEDEVRRAYGVGLLAWKRDILEPRLRAFQLLQRVVRLDTRRRPRLVVRVIVSETEGDANGIVRRVQAGADFSLIALKESKDPTAESGGVLPPIARGDLALPAVEARLFQAAPGELVGPLPVRLEGVQTWHVYRVVEQTPPWSGTRAELLERLEDDLRQEPVSSQEFARWRARTRRDFDVRLYSPDGRDVTREE